MINSADPDQLASSEANWSGSTLFAKTEHVVFSKRRVSMRPRKSHISLRIRRVWSGYCWSFHANMVLLNNRLSPSTWADWLCTSREINTLSKALTMSQLLLFLYSKKKVIFSVLKDPSWKGIRVQESTLSKMAEYLQSIFSILNG